VLRAGAVPLAVTPRQVTSLVVERTPSSETTGTIRTGVNATVASAIVAATLYALDRWADIEVSTDDPAVVLFLIPAAGAIVAFVYRLSRYLADRFPALGYVLFGIPRPPSYPDPVPAVEGDVRDRGDVGIVEVLLVVIVIVFVLFALREVR
jgi:hypothetical protein